MSLFGNLYVGAGGLQTSQNALNTTAHNLSNVGTAAYTRQQVMQTDNKYTTIHKDMHSISNMQTGLGVTYAQTRTVRDYFLDQSYRKELGRSSFYETSYNTLQEVETLLGELDGESFNESLDDLYVSLKELAKNPASSVNQGLVVTRASEFIARANTVYASLCTYQDNLNKQVVQGVNRINDIASQIYKINNDIVLIEAGGVEHANDLRDTRDKLLDELGSLGKISYSEDLNGSVDVYFEQHLLASQDVFNEMGLYIEDGEEFYTPYWTLDAKKLTGNKLDISQAKVFNLNQTIATIMDTDIGSIKAMMIARGDHRATYVDLPDPANTAKYPLGENDPQYQADVKRYDKVTSNSILMNVEAEFDNLVSAIVTSVNDVLKNASDAADKALQDANGDPSLQSDYLKMEDPVTGKKIPIQLFSRVAADLTKPVAYGPDEDYTHYSLGNVVVNPYLIKTPAALGFRNDLGEEDFDTAMKLQEAFEVKGYTLNPKVETKTNLIDYYSNIVSQIGNSGSVFKSVYESQEATVATIDNARQQVVGVSDDEELENMIRFQNAYNANSRFINVINEMLEHILSTLGR